MSRALKTIDGVETVAVRFEDKRAFALVRRDACTSDTKTAMLAILRQVGFDGSFERDGAE